MEAASKSRAGALSTGLRAVRWAAVLAIVWWAVTEGREGSLAFGVPVVIAATLLAVRVIPPAPRLVRPLPLLRFGAYFARESLKGGVDVARRALSPRMPLAPGFVELRTRLPEGGARVLLADALGLLPGTLAVDLEGDRLLVHALDAGPGLDVAVRALELQIERLLGVEPAGAAP